MWVVTGIAGHPSPPLRMAVHASLHRNLFLFNDHVSFGYRAVAHFAGDLPPLDVSLVGEENEIRQ